MGAVLSSGCYPSCFANEEQWRDYVSSARIARERCSICEDCTAKYQAEMLEQGRCDRVHGIEWWPLPRKEKAINKAVGMAYTEINAL